MSNLKPSATNNCHGTLDFHVTVIVPLNSRFSLRLMVAGSIALHAITFLAIRAQNFEASPQILHDRDPKVNPRQSRHNKAMFSRHGVWQFLLIYLLVMVGAMLALGSAKGTK